MNFLQTLIEFLKQFWPLVIVQEWERGVYYVFGRSVWRDLRPGLYAFVPWFMELRAVSVAPHPISTPLLNVTLSDGKSLVYSVTAIVQVFDPAAALNNVDDYRESTSESVASITSERIAEVAADRLDTEKRRRLITDLVRWVNQETEPYGVRVRALRFTNFGVNQRAYRLLTDTALASTSM